MPWRGVYIVKFHKAYISGFTLPTRAPMGVKFGTPLRQISPSSVQHVAPAGKKTSKSTLTNLNTVVCTAGIHAGNK